MVITDTLILRTTRLDSGPRISHTQPGVCLLIETKAMPLLPVSMQTVSLVRSVGGTCLNLRADAVQHSSTALTRRFYQQSVNA